ncbi:hypothetical protein [Rhodococcus sp. NPDC060084]|uniref:hypothetical protein n=1 Tax=Rhodococcus sp. NPDC060084 TaxID=3347053 RepID=UPI0036474BA9
MTAPGRTDLAGALRALTDKHAPHGGESGSAHAVATWARARWPSLAFTIDDGNIVCSVGTGPTLVLYSHLDTSLTGDPARDSPVTGHDRPAPTGLTDDGNEFRGFGLSVARAPAAAAIVGFAAAAKHASDTGRLTLLLARGGTHRDGTGEHGGGVRSYLARHGIPEAAIIAKGGAEGVLHDEPGAVYLRVRVSTTRGAVLSRDRATPPGGLAIHAGVVLAAVERWRTEVVLAPDSRVGQTAREAGVGSVRCGAVDKPDLLPAVLDVHIYLVTVPGDDPTRLTDALRGILRLDLADGPLASCRIAIDRGPHQPGGCTSAGAPVVGLVGRAWTIHTGSPPPHIAGWTGSTDGTVFREYGVDTVRTGPTAIATGDDPDVDAVKVTELLRYAQIYAHAGAEWLTGHNTEGQ